MFQGLSYNRSDAAKLAIPDTRLNHESPVCGLQGKPSVPAGYIAFQCNAAIGVKYKLMICDALSKAASNSRSLPGMERTVSGSHSANAST